MPLNEMDMVELQTLLKRLYKTERDSVILNHIKGLLVRLTLPTG